MLVAIDIKGEGTVTGGGVYQAGETATLTATPISGYRFKYFLIGDNPVKDNPLKIEITDSTPDIAVTGVFYVSIEDYLRGRVDFDIPDSVFVPIQMDRGVSHGQDVSELDSRTVELCYADLLMWATTTASMIQGESESDNGWSHQAQSKTLSINDKKRLEDRAIQIYRQYNDPKSLTGISTTRLKPIW